MTSKNICKFCGQEKKLIKAHIIPRNFYLDYKNEQYMEVDELSGKFTIKQNGSYDKNILCAECDGKILGKFDQEGYRILLDEIYKHCLYHDDKIKIYNLTSEYYDYNKFRRFLSQYCGKLPFLLYRNTHIYSLVNMKTKHLQY